jgi:hypothetical protein
MGDILDVVPQELPRLNGYYIMHRILFPVTMSGRLLRFVKKYGYYITLGVSVAMLLYLYASISSRCDRIFEEGPEYDCGVGIGWVGFIVAFVVIAGYSFYRVWSE